MLRPRGEKKTTLITYLKPTLAKRIAYLHVTKDSETTSLWEQQSRQR